MDDVAINKALGKRLRLFRENLKIPRTRFALTVGISSESMASYETGRVPLPYSVFVKIERSFPLDPKWLATGQGEPNWKITLNFPDVAELGMRQTSKFIDVFNQYLASALDESALSSDTHMDIEWRLTHQDFVLDALDDCYLKLPENRIKPLNKLLLDTIKRFIAEGPDDDVKAILKRNIFQKIDAAVKDEFSTGRASVELDRILNLRKGTVETKQLTDVTTSNKTGGVNHWHRLKAQIQKATENSGGKSILAKFLDVDLTQLSRWLSKNGPEPGADYTLKMLKWVQERESQQ